MKCPFCRVEIYPERRPMQLQMGPDGHKKFVAGKLCPACSQVSLYLEYISDVTMASNPASVEESILIWPKTSSRPPAPQEVPAQYADDYNEAALVLADSPKAS